MKTALQLQTVKTNLKNFPKLSAVFNRIVQYLRKQPGICGIGAKGSLIKGTVDQYSDLDLVVFVKNNANVEPLKKQITEYFLKSYPVISFFPATHIGMPNLLIFFLASGGSIIKADLEIASLREAPDKMVFQILYDPKQLLSKAIKRKSKVNHSTDWQDLYSKFTGWIWYAYTKIMRGELLEAADSISVMRSYAVVPFIQQKENLPREGLRFIEKRVSPAILKKLLATYPRQLAKKQLLDALRNLVTLFQELDINLPDDTGTVNKKANLAFMKKLLKQ